MITFILLLRLVQNAPAAEESGNKLITSGATWKYHASGNAPGDGWMGLAFDDSTWPEGVAPLGYGETNPPLGTTLSYGGLASSKWPTYYFRKHLLVSDSSSVTGLVARLLADDGAVVYLNGERVHVTTNMPEPFDGGSWANHDVQEPLRPVEFSISPSVLVTGDNVLAVEVHQAIKNSSDLFFDLLLSTSNQATTNQPGSGVKNWQVPPAETWQAFVDLAWQKDEPEIRVNRCSYIEDADHRTGGALLRFDDGQPSGVEIQFWPLTGVGVIAEGALPEHWSQADLMFSGKAGMKGAVVVPSNQSSVISFYGLNPGRQYRIVLYGHFPVSVSTRHRTRAVIDMNGAAWFSRGLSLKGTCADLVEFDRIKAGEDGHVELAINAKDEFTGEVQIHTLFMEMLPSKAPPVKMTGGIRSDEIQLTLPTSRIVFQRNHSNEAIVPVHGYCSPHATRAEGRLVARQPDWGVTTEWQTLVPGPSNGVIQAGLKGRGGWYDLELRVFTDAVEVASTILPRVGIGEVFVAVGHSVAQGDDEHEGNVYTSDDRVSVVAKEDGDAARLNMYEKDSDPRYLPGLVFSQYGSGVRPVASGRGPYIWSTFAGQVAKNENVPVLFFNAAAGGSTLNWHALSSQGLRYEHPHHNAWNRLPYGKLYNILKTYIRVTGLRAILSDNGTNDSSMDPDEESVLANYRIWVEQARKDLGHRRLAVVVNRQTPYTLNPETGEIAGNFPHIRRVQERMSKEPDCFPGPDYDTLAIGDRYDGVHLSPAGQPVAGLKWAQSLSNEFFRASVPWLPHY